MMEENPVTTENKKGGNFRFGVAAFLILNFTKKIIANLMKNIDIVLTVERKCNIILVKLPRN